MGARMRDKEFNEMLASLNSRQAPGKRELRPPRPLQTHSSKCNSWSAVAINFTLNESKQHIPMEDVVVPLIEEKDENKFIEKVALLLTENPRIKGPDDIVVNLDVEECIDGQYSVYNKARHLCGGHEYKFDLNRAKFACYIPATISRAALIAEMPNHENRFYLRRYKIGMHIVITTGTQILGQAFQRSCDLVTQYHPEPVKQFALARITYKNERLVG